MIRSSNNPKILVDTAVVAAVATTTNINHTTLSSNIINTVDMGVNHMVWATMVITLINAVDIRTCKTHIRCNSSNKVLGITLEVVSKVITSTRARRTIELVG